MLVPIGLSDTASTLIAALAGLFGAAIGGLLTLWGTIISNRAQRRDAAADAHSQAVATSLLIQDDFLHYQATLARALDRCTWWKPAELLSRQATIDDRKAVWAALPDEKTWIVAGAQGWMDYLIGNRRLQPAGDTPALGRDDAATMGDTLHKLELARQELADFTGRTFARFEDSGVFEQLTHCKTFEDLVNRQCP